MIIYLDLDGVIIDFIKGVCNWFKIPHEAEKFTHWNSMPEILNISNNEFWENIKNPCFWEGLGFYSEAENFIEKLREKYKVILISSPAHGCAGYRQNWIEKNLPEFFKKGHYILTPAKWTCAHKNTILIDDSEKNCFSFINSGGYAFLYPQPWNGRNDLSEKQKNNFILKIISEFILEEESV